MLALTSLTKKSRIQRTSQPPSSIYFRSQKYSQPLHWHQFQKSSNQQNLRFIKSRSFAWVTKYTSYFCAWTIRQSSLSHRTCHGSKCSCSTLKKIKLINLDRSWFGSVVNLRLFIKKKSYKHLILCLPVKFYWISKSTFCLFVTLSPCMLMLWTCVFLKHKHAC